MVPNKPCSKKIPSPACDKCPLQHKTPVVAHLQKAKLAVVGEVPGSQEEQDKAYFVGASGNRLMRTLKAYGQNPDEVFLNNALRCRAPMNLDSKDWRKAIECCSERLQAELIYSEATTILLLGKRAFNALSGRWTHNRPWIGAPIDSPLIPGVKLISTIHPAMALRGRGYMWPVFNAHVERAIEHSRGGARWNWQPLVYFSSHTDEETLSALNQIATSPKGTIVGLDIETAGIDPLKAPLTAVGLATHDIGVSILYPPELHFRTKKNARAAVKLIKAILRNPDLHKTAHNGTHDLLGLKAQGYPVRGYTHDTILLHHVVANLLRHDLGFVSQLEFPCDPWKPMFKVSSDLKGTERWVKAVQREPENLTLYNAKDTAILPPLTENLLKHLANTFNGESLYQGYLERSLIAADMRGIGAKVNTKALKKHARRLKWWITRSRNAFHMCIKAIHDKDKKAWHSSGLGPPEEFKLSSVPQLRILFFDLLGVVPTNWSPKTGDPSLPKSKLLTLTVAQCAHTREAAKHLLAFRKYVKLYSTYVKKLEVSKAGYIHATPKVWGTRSGRWSYSDPNLQNIPPSLRDIIKSRHENGWILEADYSQLELRIIAYLSKDKTMIEWFQQGLDLHTETARAFFNPAYDAADKKTQKRLRKIAKGINFGDNYGAEAQTIWLNLVQAIPGILLSEVENMLQLRHQIHGGMVDWRRKMVRKAYDTDYVEAPLSGRRRHFFGTIEPTKVYNHPVQGTGADIIDGAIPKVHRAFKRIKGTDLLFQVHDALIVDTTDPVRTARILQKHMEAPVSLPYGKVSFPVDFKLGKTWGDGVELGNVSDIKKYLQEVHS